MREKIMLSVAAIIAVSILVVVFILLYALLSFDKFIIVSICYILSNIFVLSLITKYKHKE
jgi:hypothetical protein